jgi:hypothetical protein
MFTHQDLYEFWYRSQSVWLCKLVKVTVSFLNEQELFELSQTHQLTQVEFGVKLSWEYHTKPGFGDMSWCVSANQPGLVFTNKGLASDSVPQIYQYRMADDNTLVMSVGKYEETIRLEGTRRRLREQRYDRKLIRRVWENKVEALVS